MTDVDSFLAKLQELRQARVRDIADELEADIEQAQEVLRDMTRDPMMPVDSDEGVVFRYTGAPEVDG